MYPSASNYCSSMDAKDHNYVMGDHDENAEAHILLSIEKLIKMQNNNTFCRDMMKLIK